MILRAVWRVSEGRLLTPVRRSAGDGEVSHERDALRGVPDAVAFQLAVPQDLPRLDVHQGVFESGADPAVSAVEVLFPAWQAAAARRWLVRQDQPGALVAAVGEHRRAEAGLVDPGVGVGPAVIAVARHRRADRDR